MDPFKQAKCKEIDAQYFGMSRSSMVDNAGKALANRIIEIIKDKTADKTKDKKAPVISIICGLGNNGADGLSCAYYLIKQLSAEKAKAEQAEIRILIIGRQQDFKTKEIQKQFSRIKDLTKKTLKHSNTGVRVELMQDAYADNIHESDFIIEAMLGSGIKGNLRKRFKDIVNKIARMRAYKIAVDSPVPGYKPAKILSLITAKQKKAEVLDIKLPSETDTFLGPGIVQFLFKPQKQAYKRKTGELLIIGGSDLFHGAPIMAIKAASKFIGSVFFYTNPANRELINKQKLELEEYISLREQDLEKYANYSNVILAGPGLEENDSNQALLIYLLNKFPEKLFVLDAYAIAMANPIRNKQNKRGFANCILTPHRGELRHIFDEIKLTGLEGKVKRLCIENKCQLVLKGHIDILFSDKGEVKMNRTGNAGMAKGGTGDILAGMIAALACKNDSWDALQAGTFLNGIAGDMAKEKFGYNFSATDLIPFLQKAYKWADEFPVAV